MDNGFPKKLAELKAHLSKVILGKSEVLEELIIALLSGDHILMEDVPGVGKTTLAKALAKSFSADFKRVQFTPDLLPTDILGSSIYNPRDGSFTFKEGPVFTNILLADEINRASPRTQSSLLEAMSERTGLDRGKDLFFAGSFPGNRHAEPHRLSRNLPAAGSPARPVRGANQSGLPRQGSGS